MTALIALLALPLILWLCRDRTERYPDGRPVDPEDQIREGYSCIVVGSPPVIQTYSLEDIDNSDAD